MTGTGAFRPGLAGQDSGGRLRVPLPVLALGVALVAAASAFVPGVPLAGLLVLPLALGRAGGFRGRFAVVLAFEIAMGGQLVPLLIGYGISPFAAIAGVSITLLLQAAILAALPATLGLVAAMLSPVFWGHPIWAALDVSPVHGAAAIAFAVALVIALAVRPVQGPALALYAVCAVLRLIGPHAPAQLPAAVGITTSFTTRSLVPAMDWGTVARKIEATPDRQARPVAVPESTLERGLPAGQAFFRKVARLSGRPILVAESTSAGPQVLAVEPRGPSRIVYRQRFPILGIDWTPWLSRGAVPHPLSTGVAPVADANGTRHQLGFLICYEAYLTLPAIETMAAAPETIVVMANDRWSRGTFYPEGGAKIRAAMAWAAGVPVVAARNT